MVEYALMLVLVALVVLLGVQLFGSAVLGLFERAGDAMP
jgi:Flp pilus assembly pilin Flp